ncbi:MAG: glycosyltransferase [Bacteroides fragilis]|mgnify:CR=1 FL=1
MKIAFVTPQMIVGGAETYIIRKSQWLIKHGYDVIVISSGGCFTNGLPQGALHYEIKDLFYAPFSIPFSRLRNVLKKLSNIIVKENVDVIEAHNAFPILYVAMSYTSHKCSFFLNVLLESSYDENYQLSFLTRMLSRRGKYFTLTEDMNSYIECKCKTKLNVNVIPIPINGCENIDTTIEGRYFLSVGRMGADKMYVKHLIIDFGKLKKKRLIDDDIKLVIVGDGDLYNEVLELAVRINKDLPNESIVLKGTVIGVDLDNLYRSCMGYIGIGTTILIAASFAKPVILASGYKKFQSFAFGYWGTHDDLDQFSIGGGDKYIKYKISFEEALFQVARSKDFRKELAAKSYSLFKQVYDMDIIMKQWELFLRKEADKLYDENLSFWGMFICLMNIILHPIYKLYKFINKIV